MKDCILRLTLSAVLLCPGAAAGLAEETGRQSDGSLRAAGSRAVVSGFCGDVTKINFKSDHTVRKSTSSSNFANLPNGDVAFSQTNPGCVLVTFTAEGFAPVGRLIEIRARLDNAVNAAPGAVFFSGDDDEDGDGSYARSHTFAFVFPLVAAGSHTVRMQFRSARFSGPVFVHKHTIIVQNR